MMLRRFVSHDAVAGSSDSVERRSSTLGAHTITVPFGSPYRTAATLSPMCANILIFLALDSCKSHRFTPLNAVQCFSRRQIQMTDEVDNLSWDEMSDKDSFEVALS